MMNISELVDASPGFQKSFTEKASEMLAARFGSFLAVIDSQVNTRNVVGNTELAKLADVMEPFAEWKGRVCRMQHHIPGSAMQQIGCALQEGNPLCGHVEMQLLIYVHSAWFILDRAGCKLPHPATIFEKNAQLDASYGRRTGTTDPAPFIAHSLVVGEEQEKHLPVVQKYLRTLTQAYRAHLLKN